MKALIPTVIALFTCTLANAAMVYEQPFTGSGTLYQSSWWDPDGSDYDMYVWDAFTLGSNQAVTELRWRGGFIYGGSYGGPVLDFRIQIYASIAGGSQPDVVNPPLLSYHTNNDAGQTLAGNFGGTVLYDYHSTLPAAFQAAGGTRYWVQIEAYQHGIPEWGWAAGSGGDGHYFRYLTGGPYYQMVSGDTTFSIWTSDAATYTVAASAAPAGSGTISGTGVYPAGSNASLAASPTAGWGFVNWTENGTQVSTSATYTFAVNANRTLVANFTPAYTVTTSPYPSFGGTSGGDGVFNSGSSVTVTAAPKFGFVFANWTEYGTPVSTSASYTFTASAPRTLVANFVLSGPGAIFDFNNVPQYTPFPINVAVGGIGAYLSGGYSIQSINGSPIAPLGFSGNMIYPNSVYTSDLTVDFTRTLTGFSIMFSPQELACDDTATLRVTAYMNGALVGTNTANASPPGTWPVGTLTCSFAQGFNSVVVSYDARPPTCQDWGPIFLADNMVVLAAAPAICPGDADCDGTVGFNDIDYFVAAIPDNQAAWAALYAARHGGQQPACSFANCDATGDGHVNFADIDPFVALIPSACP